MLLVNGQQTPQKTNKAWKLRITMAIFRLCWLVKINNNILKRSSRKKLEDKNSKHSLISHWIHWNSNSLTGTLRPQQNGDSKTVSLENLRDSLPLKPLECSSNFFFYWHMASLFLLFLFWPPKQVILSLMFFSETQ